MTHGEKSGPTTLEPGEVLLGRYEVEEQVAEGGMAAIHRTLDRMTGRRVALKVLYPYYSQNAVVCTRFLDEGRIQRYLDHPNIIDVYDIIEQPQLAIIMEYIEGPTLDEYLADHGPLNPQELLNLMLPVLSAVGFAHHKGVIHRDIKPSNILLEPTPSAMVPKIMDFGVAKVERGKDLTAAGTTVGTLHYMSPEQIVGSKDIDGRADIYSLGVTIYKLCTGEVPFNASTEFALMMAQVEARPTPPRQLRADISEKLEKIILRALSKQPAQRYQTVKELTSALLELETDERTYDETDTDTAPLPAELLEYAMMADEVAIDRTGELDITQFEDIAGIADTERDRKPPVSTADATVQIDAARLKRQVLQDRASADDVQTNELGKPTEPMERVSTREVRPVDSKERTQPFEPPAQVADQADIDPDDDPTEQQTVAADTSSDRQNLSQETTHPFRGEAADQSQERAAADRSHFDIDPAVVGDGPVDSKDITRPRVTEEADADGHAPMRARASGVESRTKRSREDVQKGFDRISGADASLSKTQVLLIGLGLVLIVALSAAIAWVLWHRP